MVETIEELYDEMIKSVSIMSLSSSFLLFNIGDLLDFS